MNTKPRNEMLNTVSERAARQLSDEFISRCVERYKQDQAQNRQRDNEVSGTEKCENQEMKGKLKG